VFHLGCGVFIAAPDKKLGVLWVGTFFKKNEIMKKTLKTVKNTRKRNKTVAPPGECEQTNH